MEEKQKGQMRKRSIKGEKVFKGTNVTLWLLNQCKCTLLMREQLSGKNTFCHCQWEGDEKERDGMLKKEWKGRETDVEMNNKPLAGLYWSYFSVDHTYILSHDLNYWQNKYIYTFGHLCSQQEGEGHGWAVTSALPVIYYEVLKWTRMRKTASASQDQQCREKQLVNQTEKGQK